jgi:hypothetical protein
LATAGASARAQFGQPHVSARRIAARVVWLVEIKVGSNGGTLRELNFDPA